MQTVIERLCSKMLKTCKAFLPAVSETRLSACPVLAFFPYHTSCCRENDATPLTETSAMLFAAHFSRLIVGSPRSPSRRRLSESGN